MMSEQRRIVAYLDELPPLPRVGGASRQAKVNALPAHAFGRLQSHTRAELEALIPSILEKGFKGELA